MGVLPNSTLDDKEKDEEERKIDELPVDDGSPVNIATLLCACASAKVFRHNSTKLSFNIKLAFLWLCVIPFPVYIELGLSYTLKDEYVDETGKKDAAILTGGLFIFFNMNQNASWVILIISYLILPYSGNRQDDHLLHCSFSGVYFPFPKPFFPFTNPNSSFPIFNFLFSSFCFAFSLLHFPLPFSLFLILSFPFPIY